MAGIFPRSKAMLKDMESGYGAVYVSLSFIRNSEVRSQNERMGGSGLKYSEFGILTPGIS